MPKRIVILAAVLMMAAAWCIPAFCFDGHDDDDNKGIVGAAYTMTNSAEGNSVVIYHRLSDGTLWPRLESSDPS